GGGAGRNLNGLERVISLPNGSGFSVHVRFPRRVIGLGKNHQRRLLRFNFILLVVRAVLSGKDASVGLVRNTDLAPVRQGQEYRFARVPSSVGESPQTRSSVQEDWPLSGGGEGHGACPWLPLHHS